MLGHMLLNDAVSPVIKLDTCITCLRMHCMVHGTARLQGECNSHKIPVETGHTWCCPWSLLLCPWIVPSLTPPPRMQAIPSCFILPRRDWVTGGTVGLDLRDPLMKLLPTGRLDFQDCCRSGFPRHSGLLAACSPLPAAG